MGKCLFMRKGETHTAPVISGIMASDLAVGSSVYLMENGVATEYLVVNQGIPSGSSLYDDSCDGLWLLRKDIKETRQWHSSNVNDYANSDIHAWLNVDFFNLFDNKEQAAIKYVKIPFVNGSGGSDISSGTSGLSARVFLLSGYEVGFTTSIISGMDTMLPVDGSKLDYFDEGDTNGGTNRTKRIAYLNGTATHWRLRSARIDTTHSVWGVQPNGERIIFNCTASTYGIRPAIILPSTAVFDETTMLLKGVA